MGSPVIFVAVPLLGVPKAPPEASRVSQSVALLAGMMTLITAAEVRLTREPVELFSSVPRESVVDASV
jgi:hypothetical protein